jgi:hypothetical protein
MNLKQIILMTAVVAGVLSSSTLLAQMNHGNHGGNPHIGNAPSQHASAIPGPAQTVFTNYVNIQTALAKDSIEGLRDSSAAISTAVRGDSAGTFSTELAQAAQDLSKARDIKAARQAFKRLSSELIKHLDAHKEHGGHFVKVLCPMANAAWLQIGSIVNNPYLGNEMARCGNIQS